MKNFKLREPVNSLTHLGGGVAAILATVFMMFKAVNKNYPNSMFTAVTVFGISMILLYFTSGIYHGVNGPKERIMVLKKMDHSMIFVLIAGTYTPVLMRTTEGNFRMIMLISIWIVALGGILFRIFWINAPRWLYTISYVIMGWVSVILLKNITSIAGFAATVLLIGGGISYTVGALIYALKKPNIFKNLGFHEIFHIFILIGTLLHFIVVYFYMM